MSSITIAPSQEKKIVTLINVFTVEPENQQRVIDILLEADQIIKTLPGYISASFHRSLDGMKVTNYAQWESNEALDAMLNNSKTRTHLQELRQTAIKFEPARYEVVYTSKA